MVTKVIICPHCGSDEVVKNGFAPNNGKQKYLCHACGRQSREDPSPNGYTQERKEEILRAYQERSSLRGLTAVFMSIDPLLRNRSAKTIPPRPPK